MAKFTKAATTAIEKLKAQLKAEKAKAAKAVKTAKAADKAVAKIKPKKPKVKKAQQVFAAGDWTGASPKKLTIYKVRLMLDEQQIGIFGPYATIRAASADAKNVLRMHVGPGYKIEEIGVDEPLLRSDGKVKVYFHPSVYSAQATDKGVLTAQVIEQGGEAQRTKTFVKKYNPSRRRKTPYSPKFNRDGTVTLWDVYAQSWSRTSQPSDRDLASLDAADRARVIRHLKLNPRKNGMGYGSSSGDSETTATIRVRRVKLDRSGYAPDGAYFGVGAPLYTAESDDGEVFFALRAPDFKLAKTKVRKQYPNATVR